MIIDETMRRTTIADLDEGRFFGEAALMRRAGGTRRLSPGQRPFSTRSAKPTSRTSVAEQDVRRELRIVLASRT